MTNKKIKVDNWVPADHEKYVFNDGKLAIIPFHEIFQRDIGAVNTFVIKKDSYYKRLGNDPDGGKGICHYLNYFLTFYDTEHELLLSYLKLKYIIDNKKAKIKTPTAFIKTMYSILFTKSMQEKVSRMVEDNYYVDLTSEDGKKYVEQLEFTNEHAKIMMKISMSMKLIVLPLFHYLNTYSMLKTVPLFNFYEPLFDMYSEEVDIYNKLYITVESKVKKNVARNRKSWGQREILGVDPLTQSDIFLKEKLIAETMFRYTFDRNIISFNSVVINKQLNYFLMTQYDHTMVELSNVKDPEGLSGLDKLEMNSYKIDESLVILSNINIKDTIKKIKKSMNVSLPKEEVQFYKQNYQINKFQVQLVNYYYAKYFGGYRDLNLLTRKQYLQLLVLLKRRMQFQGLVYLPQIITGNVEKLNKRTIQNAKFLQKIENSAIYQTLVEDKFSTLEELNKANMILNLLSTIINTTFTIVDYDVPEKLGEPLEIVNPDILSDEFLSFLNQL